MRIISLRFENINSLAGKWCIRFDDPAFSRNHLFAISGPTGAGKTTVLDAISLALYGKTPRQESIADKKEKAEGSGDDLVMTLGKGSSFSEVEFESNGARYRAIWEVHRANNRPDGKLQGAKRKLLFEENGSFVAHEEFSRTKDVNDKITEIVGLDFLQFTRAVMIPQGGFDRFLKCKREDKAAILEKLSGQEIYRKLSKAAFERNKKAQADLEEIQRKLEGIQLLSSTEEKDLGAWIRNAEELKKAKTAEQKKYEDIERILKMLVDAERECQTLRTEVQSLETENRELEASRKRLSRAEDAQRLVGPLNALKESRNRYLAKKAQKEELLKKIPESKEKFESFDADLETRIREEASLRDEDQKRNVLRETVSGLDSQKNQSLQRERERKEDVEKFKGELEKCLTELRILQTKREEVKKIQTEDETYLNAHPTHKMLESQSAAISDRLELLETAKNKLERSQDALATAKNVCLSAEKENRTKKAELEDAEKERERALSDDIDKITVFLQATIHEGDRCPVCGSTFHSVHPDRKISAGEVSATANRLQHLQTRYEAARQASDKADYEFRAAKEKVQRSENDLSDKKTAVSDGIQSALEMLGMYGFSVADLDNPANVCSKVQSWASQWESHKKSLDGCIQKQSVLDVEERNLNESAKKVQGELRSLEKDLEDEKAKYKDIDNRRKQLFGTISVADDRNLWQQKIVKASQAKSMCESGRRNAENALTAQTSQLKAVSDDLVGCEREKERLEVSFQAMLRENRFASEDEVLRAVISDSDRDAVKKKIEQVESELKTKRGSLEQAEKNVDSLRHRELGRETLETVRSKIDTLVQEISGYEKQLVEKKEKLAVNDDRKKTEAEARIQQAEQEKVVKVWKTLNDLIGDSQGKKFVEYVQGLTLQKLIRAANRHLSVLNSRYSIVSDGKSFDIRLYDSENGASRLAASLSGGETFLLSLSLALGLSSLASQRVRIDTLFLDEGFGSLDEDKLQKAIELLRRLGENGDKLVGVISHVDRLKEEISNHIEVTSLGCGHSKLSGPGVSAEK